jgi:hypothetical protein
MNVSEDDLTDVRVETISLPPAWYKRSLCHDDCLPHREATTYYKGNAVVQEYSRTTRL